VPFLRVHGEYPYREMWQFGGKDSPAYAAQLSFDNVRYRLMPYIYSLAGMVNHDGGTIMRPLVMDFKDDQKAKAVTDQYMFGPSIMVCPVTEYKARKRMVYLPKTKGDWYSIADGKRYSGGQSIIVSAPYERIPLFLKPGAILPTGPEISRAEVKSTEPLGISICTGADGKFTLYEDDGLTYKYEQGECSRIPITWNNAKGILTIGTRVGAFPGLLKSRSFFVVAMLSNGHAFIPKTVEYSGKAISVKLR